jgi:hypothetical protein
LEEDRAYVEGTGCNSREEAQRKELMAKQMWELGLAEYKVSGAQPLHHVASSWEERSALGQSAASLSHPIPGNLYLVF